MRAPGKPPRRSRFHRRLPLFALFYGGTSRLNSASLSLARSPKYAVRALVIIAVVVLGACPQSITDSGLHLTVSPTTASLFVDDTEQLSATLRDQNGATVNAPLRWTSDRPAVASVDANGVVRALSEGTATIQVSAQGETASVSITVAVDNGTLTVSPSGASLWVDASQQFRAVLTDRNGDTLPAAPVWRSTNPDAATVDQSGLVRGVGTGSATIEATVGQETGSAAVTVGARPASVTLVGAGDIASCTSSGDEATAKLLDSIPGTVFTAGDNAYENGTAVEYTTCYAPSWGRHKARTRPAAGNHEYLTPGALGYFGYFRAAAGDTGKGYYSYDLGAWHVIVVNSNLNVGTGSPQETWLRADLAAHSPRCTVAIWHHPRFSSGPHGSSAIMQSVWKALYDGGADLVVVGHDHLYERFAPQNADGQLDMAHGMREFVVGTGGATAYAIVSPAPNSEVRNSGTRGVLKLTLYPDRYDWKFVPVKGSTFTDSGSASCH